MKVTSLNYIRIIEEDCPGLPSMFSVVTRDEDWPIGAIKWVGRGYVYIPAKSHLSPPELTEILDALNKITAKTWK